MAGGDHREPAEREGLPAFALPAPSPMPSLAVEPTAHAQGVQAAEASVLHAPAPVTQAAAAHEAGRVAPSGLPASVDWTDAVADEVRELIESGRDDVWDALTRRFEARMITAALESTRGRRIEAAQRLGIGRNTITRKIQELGLGE
jgi:two-component system nitrogen regulation response regulator GlnG